MIRIGIDLGTTNTLAAMTYDDGPHVMPRHQGQITPSVVYFRWDDGENDVLVGEEAANHGSDRVVRSIKRLMGRTYEEALNDGAEKYFPPSDPSVRLVGHGGGAARLEIHRGKTLIRTLWPQEITSHILRKIKTVAENSVGRSIDGAVITVPAYFRDPHRHATLEAARMAGLNLIEPIIDEPTAAVLAFSSIVGVEPGEPVLVVDWGGGTLDVTLQMSDGRGWMQLAIGGNLILGGDDIDLALAQVVLQRSKAPESVLNDPASRYHLFEAVRKLKHGLSERDEFPYMAPGLIDPVTGRTFNVMGKLTRREFEGSIATLLDAAISGIEACLARPEVTVDGIRKVLLVGGSTRIPALRQRLAALLPKAHLHDEIDPMRAVALGAALYANEARPDISSVCAYGYAIKTADGTIHDLIEPEAEVPTPLSSPYSFRAETTYDHQTVYRVTLHAFAKPSKHLRAYSRLRAFARGMKPLPKGTPVWIDCWIDENKQLRIGCRQPGEETRHLEVVSGNETSPSRTPFTELLDCTCETEALIEANKGTQASVLDHLSLQLTTALDVEARKDLDAAQPALVALRESVAEATAARESQDAEIDQRERVLGWVQFFEQDLLPRFSVVIPPAQYERLLQHIKALRVMLSTGAPNDELSLELFRLISNSEDGEMGSVLTAYRWASVRGVPENLAQRLTATALTASRHKAIGDTENFKTTLDDLEGTLKQAQAAWKRSRESATLVAAMPDLIVKRTENARES